MSNNSLLTQETDWCLFSCIRHKRQQRRHVSDSRTNLHLPGDREKVYIVTEKPAYPQEKPGILEFPIVSHAPLPGKE